MTAHEALNHDWFSADLESPPVEAHKSEHISMYDAALKIKRLSAVILAFRAGIRRRKAGMT